MKIYFDILDFITFLNLLEENKPDKVFTESLEDGSIAAHTFMKMQFSSNTIILYDHPSCCVGIIQDSPVAPWEDYAEAVFEDLTVSGEHHMYIEAQ